MLIKKAESQDLEELVSLLEAYRAFYQKDPAPVEARNFLRERLHNQDSEIFVASEDGLLVGFVQLYPLFSSTRLKRLWLLNDLFVVPAYRGKGISMALIDACKTLCRESNSCGMILETAKDNLVGNQLYPKAGFSLDKDHNYYEWEIEKV